MSQSLKSRPPIGDAEGKKEQIEEMFDSIAPRYDLLNRVLSMGIDQGWRRKAVSLIEPYHPKEILDMATGTADLALLATRLDPTRVVGVDLSEEMLLVGRRKVERRGLADVIRLEKGDAENLRFEDASFDAALVAFGVRNFGNLKAGLADMKRVLRPGAPLVVLEFSHPRTFPVKQAYEFYSKHVLPRIGGALSKDSGAYEYLPESVAAFPDGADFIAILGEVGYSEAEAHPLTFGIASLYRAIA